MSVEILRLERSVEDGGRGEPRLLMASYLLAAVTLRDQLIRISGSPESITEIPCFGRFLAEATLGAYR